MPADRLFPRETPEPGSPVEPLDDHTAERLLTGQLEPDDAPRPYAEVARVLQAVAPPAPDELAGEAAALAMFRAARGGVGGRRAGGRAVRGRSGGGHLERDRSGGGHPARGRARLVAVALAGALAVGGLWMGGGARIAGELRSPTGGPGAGGSGFGTSGSLSPARPATGPGMAPGLGMAPGTAPGGGVGGPPDLPSAHDRATARHRGGATSRGGGAAHDTRPGPAGMPPKPKPDPSRPKASKPKPAKPHPATEATGRTNRRSGRP